MAMKYTQSGYATMDNGAHAVCASSSAGALRFIQRGDKRILQQEWATKTSYSDTTTRLSGEWRDVPLVDEGDGG